MTEATVAVVGLLVFAWAIFSGALARRNITGPLLFAAAGYLLSNPSWGLLSVNVETSSVHVIAEVTLALVLFSDAARVNAQSLRRDLSLPARLLTVGLLLSVVLGALLAFGLFADLPWALAGFLGAALAPTDAALSVQIINDDRIPTRLRQALNVESGLNDGIVTPIVTVMLAVAASQLGVVSHGASYESGTALRELAVGLGIGLLGGVVGARLLSYASTHGWIANGGRQIASLAVAVSLFALALTVHGNGFIAAFVAGIAFGAALHTDEADLEQTDELPTLGGELLALLVWFLFGATLVPIAFEYFDASMALYALLSLTLVRMIPVGIALIRSGLDTPSMVFVAWFGPRGLASVVFALLALEECGDTSVVVNRAVGAVALTVLLSVVFHGISAGPGGRLFVDREELARHRSGPS